MKKLFYFVAIAFILVCSWQIWQHPETFRSYLGDFSPTACLLPMKYKIVQVDSKFGLKTEDFKIAVAQAVDTWNKNLNKIAFVYDEATPDLKVNLIYDDRQSETQKLNQLNQVISLDKNQYGNLSTQRNALLATYQVDLVKYNSTIESYNNQVAEYQKVVAGWNARGGAPKTEYNSLQTTKRNLETLAANIEIQRQSLNRQVNAINSVTSDVNTAAKVVNQKVNVYNSSDLIGSEFEQGIFILKGFDKQINIYQY
ncbi:MAG: hypothetical protein WCO30_01935, partial [bacterium]